MSGKELDQQHSKIAHARPTVTAAVDTSASVIAPIPLSAHCSPRDAHTAAQLWSGAPRCHCGATVAVADADTPCVRLDVGVVLAVPDFVAVLELVPELVAVVEPVPELVAVIEPVPELVLVVEPVRELVLVIELVAVPDALVS